MTKITTPYPSQEPVSNTHRHLLCWKSILGGLFISLMAFVTLTALGAALAGFTADGLIAREEGGYGLLTGAALYLGLSIVIALFCGSYFSLRVSRFLTAKVGAAHGFVIASMFFLLMLVGLGKSIGGLAAGFGNLVEATGSGGLELSKNPIVQDSLNQAFGGSALKSDPKEVAQGLTVRLLRGDTESAKKYFTYETGLSSAEVDTKIAALKTQITAAAEKTARALGDTGLTLFIIFLVGLVSALIGGRIGAHSNVERPFALSSELRAPSFGLGTLATDRGSVVPYVFGWLLGIPVSVLILIAMFRAVF